MRRTAFALAFLFCAASNGFAQLDPETATPYQLKVVLGFSEHRLLTQSFRQQVQRELRDSLQAALGNLARVEVLLDHPLLPEVQARSLKNALDSWRIVNDEKLHFVLVSYAQGEYAVQARQYDGLTGMASPLLRRASIAERLLVARQAALLVAKDFGLVGTIVGNQGGKVDLSIKGALLEGGADWIKKDDIFAIAQICKQPRGGERSYRLQSTFLQVLDAPKEGICPCMLLHRYENPLRQSPGHEGFRCLKLGTEEGPIRVRLVDDRGLPLNGKMVKLRATGFEGPVVEQGTTNSDGVWRGQRKFRNLAFAIIQEGSEKLAQLPIEVFEDHVAVFTIVPEEGAESRGQLYQRRDRWTRRVADTLGEIDSLFAELNKLKSATEQIKPARDGWSRLKGTIVSIKEERDSLSKEAELVLKGVKFDTKIADQLEAQITARLAELELHLAKLDEHIASENDPKRKRWNELILQGDSQFNQREFDKALELWKQVLSEGYKDEKLAKRYDELREGRKIKNDDHNAARQFLEHSWPALKTAKEMQDYISTARKHLGVCRELKDVYAPLIFLDAARKQVGLLQDEAKGLDPETRDDDRKPAEVIKSVSSELAKLMQEAAAIVSSSQPKATNPEGKPRSVKRSQGMDTRTTITAIKHMPPRGRGMNHE